jgi:hypothetical protein
MYVFLALIVILGILFVAAKTTSRESFVGQVPLNTKTNVVLPMDKVVEKVVIKVCVRACVRACVCVCVGMHAL